MSAVRLTKQRRIMGCENIHDNNNNNNKPMDRQHSVTVTGDLTALRSPMAAKGGLLGSCAVSNEVEMQEADQLDFLPKSPNIDEQDIGNPLAAVDYIEDIHDFYRKSEVGTKILAKESRIILSVFVFQLVLNYADCPWIRCRVVFRKII